MNYAVTHWEIELPHTDQVLTSELSVRWPAGHATLPLERNRAVGDLEAYLAFADRNYAIEIQESDATLRVSPDGGAHWAMVFLTANGNAILCRHHKASRTSPAPHIEDVAFDSILGPPGTARGVAPWFGGVPRTFGLNPEDVVFTEDIGVTELLASGPLPPATVDAVWDQEFQRPLEASHNVDGADRVLLRSANDATLGPAIHRRLMAAQVTAATLHGGASAARAIALSAIRPTQEDAFLSKVAAFLVLLGQLREGGSDKHIARESRLCLVWTLASFGAAARSLPADAERGLIPIARDGRADRLSQYLAVRSLQFSKTATSELALRELVGDASASPPEPPTLSWSADPLASQRDFDQNVNIPEVASWVLQQRRSRR